MRLIGRPVPHRQGWFLGEPITSGTETRVAVTHGDSGEVCWVFGETSDGRTEAAQRVIDGVYERRAALMAELIEQGDQHGPNVRLVQSPDADDPGA